MIWRFVATAKAHIYLTVFGGYYTSKRHAPQTVPADFFSFSQAHHPSLPSWLEGHHSRLMAKYYNLYPYVLDTYWDYDYVSWIDGTGALLSTTSLESLIGY